MRTITGLHRVLPISTIFAGSSLAYFILMTTFSSYLHDHLHFAVPTTGLVLFGYAGVSRASKVILGPLFDRMVFRISMPLSLCVAAGGFFLASLRSVFGAWSPWFLCLAGVGISSVVLLTQSFIAHEKEASSRGANATDYSFVYILMNGGALIAPLIGFALLRRYPSCLYAAIGGLYVGLTLFSLGFLQEPQRAITATADTPVSPFVGWQSALGNAPYRVFLLANIAAWMLYAQLFSTVPLYIKEVLGGESALAWIFALEALAVIVLQYLISRVVSKATPAYYLPLAFCLFALSFLVLFAANGVSMVVFAMVLFSAAAMVFMPSADASNARFAEGKWFATYFGLLSLSATVGDAGGSAAGMRALAVAQAAGASSMYFLLLAGVALLSAIWLAPWTRLGFQEPAVTVTLDAATLHGTVAAHATAQPAGPGQGH